MAYGTIAQLKRYLGIVVAETSDDLILEECLDRATSVIHLFSGGRRFEPAAMTRWYDAVEDTSYDHKILHTTDDDLIWVTAIQNGDGSAVDLTDVILTPDSPSPEAWVHHGIRFLEGSWTYTTRSFHSISVTGWWGWVERRNVGGKLTYITPASISQALMRMAGFFYKEKDSQVFEVTGYFGEGAMIIPPGFPVGALDIIKSLARKI